MSTIRLTRLSSHPPRALLGRRIVQRHAFRLLVLEASTGTPLFKANQFHSSCVRRKNAELVKQETNVYLSSKQRDRKLGPRYPRGPTIEGLKIVVRALQEGPSRMHSKEIWDYIHENGLGLEYSIPGPRHQIVGLDKRGVQKDNYPEPTYPTHPVRSFRYMKVQLLKTLEAHNRIQKIHVLRDPITPAEKLVAEAKRDTSKRGKQTGIDSWVWELIPVPEGKVPFEERPGITVSSMDQLWRREMRRRQSVGTDIDIARPERASASTLSSDPHERSRLLLADSTYGDKLTAQWRAVTRKSLHTPLKSQPGAQTRPSWKDLDAKSERNNNRALFNHKSFEASSRSDTSQTVTEEGRSQPATPRVKPWLNPGEPENRQSPRGRDAYAVGLGDAGLRQFGFHYGLPKQKELLRAANAREWEHDQTAWISEA
ncbi:hypothetical protein FRC17_001952 [Serendipita sp. 399]|nr:hypothetical protein FRC17_001952 [Serendipita sp. 399]